MNRHLQCAPPVSILSVLFAQAVRVCGQIFCVPRRTEIIYLQQAQNPSACSTSSSSNRYTSSPHTPSQGFSSIYMQSIVQGILRCTVYVAYKGMYCACTCTTHITSHTPPTDRRSRMLLYLSFVRPSASQTIPLIFSILVVLF